MLTQVPQPPSRRTMRTSQMLVLTRRVAPRPTLLSVSLPSSGGAVSALLAWVVTKPRRSRIRRAERRRVMVQIRRKAMMTRQGLRRRWRECLLRMQTGGSSRIRAQRVQRETRMQLSCRGLSRRELPGRGLYSWEERRSSMRRRRRGAGASGQG
jgi:hypothetical protein